MANELAEKIHTQIESCQRALERLEEALGYAGENIPARLDVDAAIQRFEFCFELIWKLTQSLVRYQGRDCQSPRDCFRISAQIGLINDPSRWIEYLHARNLTVHTYDESTADSVYQTAKRFAQDAALLIASAKKTLT